MLPKLAFLLLLAVPAAAQSSPGGSSIEGKILALENAWGQAEKAADSKALETLLDDALVYVRYDGGLWNKRQYLVSLKDPASRIEQAVTENMVAHLFGETTLVTGIYRVKGVERGKPYARRERFIDTWVHRGNVWVCVATQVTPMAGR